MIYRNHYLDKKSIPYFADAIAAHYLRQPGCSRVAVVCMGSSRYAYDALGPKIGSRLAERLENEPRVQLFGTSDKPVHALNLHKMLTEIAAFPELTYVIAVDACLGQYYKIGTLQLVEEPLQPGTAYDKQLPAVGHIHFKGVVNNHAQLKLEILDHPSLRFIEEMALVMSKALNRAIQQIVPLLLPYEEGSSGTTDFISSGM